MARKNLKKEPIDVNKLMKDAKKKKLPAFDEKPKKIRFRLSQFWHDEKGMPSKRAFFFSLFSFLGAWYIIFAAFAGEFIGELGIFIISGITVFGVAYHKKSPGISSMLPDMNDQDFQDRSFTLPQGVKPAQPWPKPPAKRALKAIKSTFK